MSRGIPGDPPQGPARPEEAAGVRLIGLSAYARAGKDAVADILISHGYQRTAFADAIYDVVTGMNPVVPVRPSGGPRYWLRRHRRLTTLVDRHGWNWIKAHCPEGRRLLNALGAGIRAHEQNFWVQATMRGLNLSGDPAQRHVLVDCRFPAEVEALRAAGGVLVRIIRPGVEAARDPHTGQPYASETAIADIAPDYTLSNDGPTLAHLADATRALLQQIHADSARA